MIKDEYKFVAEIHEEYEVFRETHFYHDKGRGRILIMKPVEGGDYDELLLFSPLGTLETLSSNSYYDATELEKIIEKMLSKNTEFRSSLINDLCEAKRKFNATFRIFFGTNFDFFSKCELIAEINPFCLKRSDFKDLTMRLSGMIDSFNKEETAGLLGDEVRGSIDALRKAFQKADKKHHVTEELNKLSVIHSLRHTIPVHETDKYFPQFLKIFQKEYPDNAVDWTDLSIFVLQETARIVKEISGVLSQ
ncbi:MAG: hypothetical protein HXS52_14180 [Theionarchaea archaeon]|nr:hypothetical protein [Theionarchaea archaeon]